MPSFPFASLLLLLGLRAAAAAGGGGGGAATEADILLAFKNSLSIPATVAALFASWDPAALRPCNFTGVTCDARGSVTGIALPGAGVGGALPLASLCSLPSLARLSMPSNALAGGLAGVGGCTGLVELTLAFNNLSGQVPDLSPLTRLQVLNISSNAFTGQFPWAALPRLTALKVLSVGDNSFAPSPAFPDVVTTLTNLTVLYLSATNIGGVIPPEIGRLTELVDLELSDNRIHGAIPPEITRLTKLQQLELYNNSLTGELPAGFGNLSQLRFLDASMNNLTGHLSELRSLNRLVSLQLFVNDFSGEVPPEFGDFRELVNLSLYSNRLTGELPPSLGSWAEFNFIDVSTNALSGPIPPDMCKKGTMLKLLMLENNFSGAIPASYGECPTLLRFRVSKNSLTGEVPAGIWALPNAENIDVSGNQLNGTIGAGIGKASSLSWLNLAGNRFSGTIPQEIGGATSLVHIDASSNDLSGELPASLGRLTSLDSLHLWDNDIAGTIPASLGECKALSTINLAGNSLSGEIPAALGDLSRLNYLDVSSNSLSGEVPASLAGLKLSYLNLSNNRLAGPLPEALSIAAYGDSFLGNQGLCATNGATFLHRCPPGAGHGGSPDGVRTAVTCLLASAAFLLAALGTAIYVKKRRAAAAGAASGGGGKLFAKKGSWDMKSFRILAFDEQEIVAGVRDENLIGSGGSGNVYRVKLGNGTVVAVKHITRVTNAGGTGAEAAMLRSASGTRRTASLRCREFDAEVGTLSAIRHVNVVKLYCSITSDDDGGAASLLVYEHLPNGSLYDRLHTAEGRKLGGLGWPERYDIAVGAARGLEYLHHGCDRPILHRDVKSSNILLDESFKPRIADFGLAKILHSGGTAVDSSAGVVAGTLGYMAPEYGYAWKVTEKSDVYSFGVVLLELVTGRLPIEAEYGESKDIVHWVSRRLDCREKVMALLDKRIAAEELSREEAVRVLRVAVLCTSRTPSARPSMRTVVQMLEDAAGGPAGAAARGKEHKVLEVKLMP